MKLRPVPARASINLIRICGTSFLFWCVCVDHSSSCEHAAFHFFFLLVRSAAIISLRSLLFHCDRANGRSNKKVPVIYINRFLLLLLLRCAMRRQHLTFGRWFYYWFHHFNEFQAIRFLFPPVVTCLQAIVIEIPVSASFDAIDWLRHMVFVNCVMLCLGSYRRDTDTPVHIERIWVFVSRFSMKNYEFLSDDMEYYLK